jgi:UDPglucose 6-dehydrogenase
VAIVGCGHVGLVTGACFATLGHHVVGVDIDSSLIERLNGGRITFFEPDLAELVQSGRSNGRLWFTTSYEKAIGQAEFIFLSVDTPSTSTGAADLRHVRRAITQIADALNPNAPQPLIVNKSTSPIGTGETIDVILRGRLTSKLNRPRIVANPEFLREGTAVQDFFHPHRIVIGAQSGEDAQRVASLYAGIQAPLVFTDVRSAELIKYVSNAFLATRVSFINEVARLCEGLNTDIDDVLRGVSLDSRLGADYLDPGIGYGGSCLPKDVAALCHTGDTVGVPMRVLAAVEAANANQRKHVVNSLRNLLGPLEGVTIAVWGITFKGGTEDLRESPAIDVITLLRNEGAWVRAYNPGLPTQIVEEFADEVAQSPLEAVDGARCLAILSDWTDFRAVDLLEVRNRMEGRLVYDGRNVLQRADVEAAGLLYHGSGRPFSAGNTVSLESQAVSMVPGGISIEGHG